MDEFYLLKQFIQNLFHALFCVKRARITRRTRQAHPVVTTHYSRHPHFRHARASSTSCTTPCPVMPDLIGHLVDSGGEADSARFPITLARFGNDGVGWADTFRV